jgi:small-conductance mechanosensitive channel
MARFDRAHFKAFGDSSLNFEVVYYVLAPDYNVYMDLQQTINLELYRRFDEQGIEFAYPTRTLYVRQEGAVSAQLG